MRTVIGSSVGSSVGLSLALVAMVAGDSAGERALAPAPKVQTAEVALREAEVSGAAQYAPLDLRLAREKLDQAQRATDDGDRDRARRLADEALVDAQVAEAKANAEKARRNADEARKSIEALRNEAARPLEER